MQWEEHLPSVLGNPSWGDFFELCLGLFALPQAVPTQLPGKLGTKIIPCPKHPVFRDRAKYPFSHISFPVFS